MDLKEWQQTGMLHLTGEDLNDPGVMLVVQNALDKSQDAYMREIKSIADSYDIDEDFASCVWYLRTRSRWTQELELRLVQMAKEGQPVPNMCEWPAEERKEE